MHDSTACPDQEIKLWGPIPIREPTSTSASRCSARSASPTLTLWQRVRFRCGYQNSADDNQIVNGLTSDEHAIGYFGYAYYEENANQLGRAIANNDTHGVQDAGNAVAPETSTVADGSYAPLSRSIYMNANNDWDLVRGFFDYDIQRPAWTTADVGYVPLPADVLAEMTATWLSQSLVDEHNCTPASTLTPLPTPGWSWLKSPGARDSSTDGKGGVNLHPPQTRL